MTRFRINKEISRKVEVHVKSCRKITSQYEVELTIDSGTVTTPSQRLLLVRAQLKNLLTEGCRDHVVNKHTLALARLDEGRPDV